VRCSPAARAASKAGRCGVAAAREIPRDARQLHVFVGGVLAHRADDRDRLDRAGVQSREDGPDHLRHREAALQVQAGRPAHLEVVDVLGRGIDAQLERDPFERFLGLHHGDCGLEVLDVLGLAGAIVGRDHAKPLIARKLLRGGDTHRTVEVRMQLGFLPAEIRRGYVSE